MMTTMSPLLGIAFGLLVTLATAKPVADQETSPERLGKQFGFDFGPRPHYGYGLYPPQYHHPHRSYYGPHNRPIASFYDYRSPYGYDDFRRYDHPRPSSYHFRRAFDADPDLSPFLSRAEALPPSFPQPTELQIPVAVIGAGGVEPLPTPVLPPTEAVKVKKDQEAEPVVAKGDHDDHEKPTVAEQKTEPDKSECKCCNKTEKVQIPKEKEH